jgi:flagellin
MSTRINTNVTALSAAQNLNANSNKLSGNIERLSSGLRINSAADDPAGLAISQEFKAQISGISQAISNNNDAINEVKTAEGALNQVQALLVSMRQLAVHASNLGVNSTTDVAADQTQINSAIASINRIASTTSFGNKKLLDGSATSANTTTAGTASATGNMTLTAQGSYNAATAGTYNTVSVTAATASTDTYSFINPNNSVGLSTASTGTYAGSLIINGTQYSLSTAAPQTLTGLNAAIASSGYQASVSGGQLVFTNQTTGQLANTAAFNVTNLTVGTNSLVQTTVSGTPSTFTAGQATVNASNVTGGGSISGAADLTLAGSLAVTITDAATTFTAKAYTVTWAAGASLASVESSLTTATGGVVSLGLDATGASLQVSSGGGVSVGFGMNANTINGAAGTLTLGAAAGNNSATLGMATVSVSAGVNGATLTSSSYFAGVITVAGSSTATYTLAPGTNLASLNTTLASVGVAAAVNSAGSLIFGAANSGTGSFQPSVTMGASFEAYNALTNNSGGSGAFSNGTNAVMTLSNATSTLTSTSTQSTGSTNYFSFSNGAVISTTVTSGSVVGSLTATAGTSSAGQNLQFQIGSNGGQTSAFAIQSIAANLLGSNAASYVDANGTTQTVTTDSVLDLDVQTFKGSQDAIAVIDQAIDQISTLRANLGAFQDNVLQSNVTSLGIAQQNLSSSLSTIEDTDLSTEIVDYTKNQILVQAGTSALGQANQAPQAILKLLQ